jgi:hypothetical protein
VGALFRGGLTSVPPKRRRATSLRRTAMRRAWFSGDEEPHKGEFPGAALEMEEVETEEEDEEEEEEGEWEEEEGDTHHVQ